MNTVYLGIGSNLGNRFDTMQAAIDSISKKIGKVTIASSVYESEPIGFHSDEKFFNACLKIETKITALEVLDLIHEIEHEFGRIRTGKEGYSSRTLDIDILYFNDQISHLDKLKIPHPHLHKRQFVLIPLLEIADELIDPRNFLTIRQMSLNCPDESILTKKEIRFIY